MLKNIHHIQNARELFPRGLTQPQGTFRFSIDALLLASFARCSAKKGKDGKQRVAMADLGTGCGVVGLTFCLLHEDVRGLGLEIEASLVEAARENAKLLGLEESFTTIQADIAHLWPTRLNKEEQEEPLRKASYDIVLCNPPYRLPQSGRAAATNLRQQALFEESGSLDDFVRTAASLLRNAGRFNIIYGAGRLADLLTALRQHKLEPKRLRMIHSYIDSPARLVLVEAMRGAKPDIIVEPPLILYEKQDSSHEPTRHYTESALQFCPFLSCNAR